MANPILHPRYAMWAAAGLLTGCGLTLIATQMLGDADEARHRAEHEALHYKVTRVSTRAPVRGFMVNQVAPTRAVARSSVCAQPGKIRGVSTSEHCCWYGQRWSSAQSRCIGTPFKCPDGHIALDEACVVLAPSMSHDDVEAVTTPRHDAFEACFRAHTSLQLEPLWLDFAISPQGQAFAIRPSSGQPWTRESRGARIMRCVQDRLIEMSFPRGHRTTQVHHLAIDVYLTPEIQ